MLDCNVGDAIGVFGAMVETSGALETAPLVRFQVVVLVYVLRRVNESLSTENVPLSGLPLFDCRLNLPSIAVITPVSV